MLRAPIKSVVADARRRSERWIAWRQSQLEGPSIGALLENTRHRSPIEAQRDRQAGRKRDTEAERLVAKTRREPSPAIDVGESDSTRQHAEEDDLGAHVNDRALLRDLLGLDCGEVDLESRREIELREAAAIERLRVSPETMWREFGVVLPRPSNGFDRFDQRTDVVQLGLMGLSVVLGRRVTPARNNCSPRPGRGPPDRTLREISRPDIYRQNYLRSCSTLAARPDLSAPDRTGVGRDVSPSLFDPDLVRGHLPPRDSNRP